MHVNLLWVMWEMIYDSGFECNISQQLVSELLWLKNFCYNPNLRVLCKVEAMDMHVGSEALQGMEHMLQVFFCRFWPLGYQDLLGLLQI